MNASDSYIDQKAEYCSWEEASMLINYRTMKALERIADQLEGKNAGK